MNPSTGEARRREGSHGTYGTAAAGVSRSALRAGVAPRWSAPVSGTLALADVDASDYDAVIIAGGQSPMVTMCENEELHRFIADFHPESLREELGAR